MDFEKLVSLYEHLEKTSSGNEMREILANFLKNVPAEDIGVICYLTLGTIASEFEGVVLGMADKSVLKAIASAGGTELSKVQKKMQETGDAGLTAEQVLQKKPQTLVPLETLTVHELFEKLHKIATASGTGSQDQKCNILVSLLQKSSPQGAKYVCRIALGTLRMGVGDMTVLDALAIAFTGEKKNKEYLEQAYNLCPDVGVIAETVVKKGLKGLEKIEVKVGRPIKMMLAQRVEQLDEISKKITGQFTVEAKYDGERVQIHKDKKGKITLFSRRLDTITQQFPDLVKELQKQVKGDDYILEGEIVAIDKEGNHLPFQTLMQRRRKYDIEQYAQDIPVQVKLFDVLYDDGTTYLHEPYLQRQKKLASIVKKTKHITLTERISTESIEELDEFFQNMLEEGYEGVIVKSHDGEYQAGTRGWNWIKWKKDYTQDMSDTLDLVIIGAFHGKGKRSGTYGALLCACYDEKNDQFLTICKLGTGLTDQVLEELPEKLKKDEVQKQPARVVAKKEMHPDIWFTPHHVVEVLGAELTKSPFHSAGIAVRFPRFIRFREKKAEQATTLEEVKKMVRI
ncbi:MAG TPA: ATP-dependent DNA ligase [Candidatus Nanoarchaeia archaeon]|nr:ATP-dependent DNA ligase [Candidatus Nanoarchaeia archaeon]